LFVQTAVDIKRDKSILSIYMSVPDILLLFLLIFLIPFFLSLQDEILEFLEVLVLCHTIRVDRKEFAQNGSLYGQNPAGQGMEYEYQASSPDEKAFVEACRR
jgi:magnesium-transporting ATPase (P-type)